MRGYQCKCGNIRGATSMGITQCLWCDKCKTTAAFGPDSHKTERVPHLLYPTDVEVDDGIMTLHRCRYCLKTKKEIIELGEPYEFKK